MSRRSLLAGVLGGMIQLALVMPHILQGAAAYEPAVEQWRPTVQDACGGAADCESRIMWLISCESGGNQYAVSERVNPGTGAHDYGLLQLSTIWEPVTYADGATQIYWTAEHLGTVWWAC